jgi:hypothetical protein
MVNEASGVQTVFVSLEGGTKENTKYRLNMMTNTEMKKMPPYLEKCQEIPHQKDAIEILEASPRVHKIREEPSNHIAVPS